MVGGYLPGVGVHLCGIHPTRFGSEKHCYVDGKSSIPTHESVLTLYIYLKVFTIVFRGRIGQSHFNFNQFNFQFYGKLLFPAMKVFLTEVLMVCT